jgi:hypothetical protein
MIPVQPTLISQPFANGGEKNVIPNSGGEVLGNASYLAGFPQVTEVPLELGGVPPQRKDFNGILNAITKFNFFQQSGGVFTYSNTLNYIPGCVVRYSNTEFVCITENGVDSVNGVHSPADATYWKKHTHPFIGINSTGINAVNFDGGGATGADAIAIGKGTVSRASASVALGSDASVESDGTNSVAIGNGADAKAQVSVALGSDALVTSNGSNSVALGYGAVAESSLVVSVGNGNQNRKIVNMADGTDAKDAVNVSQLNAATTAGTKAQLDSGTNTATKVWSPKVLADYAKGEYLLDNNGYIKHQSGLMIQWGRATFGQGETAVSVSLGDHPFSSHIYCVVATDRLAQEQTGVADDQCVTWVTDTSTLSSLRFASARDNVAAFCWIAIGV